jgi:beta-lactamase superfamily II metal-dependent hydrolase
VKYSVVAIVSLVSVALAIARPLLQTPDSLDIYVIDVEGGKSTLVVSPSKESLLIDTGDIGEGARRDAGRIMAAAREAGLQRIDHLVTTHWHRDHIGAMALVAQHLPILEFIDHGATVQHQAEVDAFLQQTYPALHANAKHTVVSAGDIIRLSDVDVRVVTSAGKTIRTPLAGTRTPNPYCDGFNRQPIDKTENSQSIGIHLTFGRFRALDLGDLTVNKEFELMCPTNPVGTVDLFMVSHHGQASSNSEVLVHALEARVAVMNNGTRKGGQPQVMKALHTAPGLEDLWQLHFSQLSGQEYSAPGLFIANRVDEPQHTVPLAPMPVPRPGEGGPPPAHNGTAYWIKISAHQDGSFAVTNTRNGFSKIYSARRE